MKTIKNIIGTLAFLLCARIMVVSMRWITNDKSRIASIEETIALGEAAKKTKENWKTITKN